MIDLDSLLSLVNSGSQQVQNILLVLIVGWILIAFNVGLRARKRGGNFVIWVIVGLVFGPFGSMMTFFLSDKIKCPECGIKNPRDTKYCEKCNHLLLAPKIK